MKKQILAILCALFLLPVSAQAFEIEFVKDKWQLVSFSVLPEDSTVENVFGITEGDQTFSVNIWGYSAQTQNWATWVPENTFNPVQPLTHLQVGMGYWVKLNKDLTISIDNGVTQSGAIYLTSGWNLIGYTAQEKVTHAQALEGVAYSGLWEYDSATSKFNVIEKSQNAQVIVKSEFTYLKPGKGYWINATEQAELLPRLKTLLPPDIDVAPLVQLQKYGERVQWTQGTGDTDWADDGYFDFPNTQIHLGFGDFLNRQSIHIENIGNGLLSWTIRIPENLPWLYIETQNELEETIRVKELNGSTVNIASKVTFLVDRTAMEVVDGGISGKVQITANGIIDNQYMRIAEEETGESANLGEFTVSMSVPDIVGDYEITVKLDRIDDKAADLHQPKYFLSMARDGALKGFLDPERSLLVPQLTYLSGNFIRDPAGHFQMTGSVVVPSESSPGKSNPMNPFNRDIKREFSFVGQRSDGYDGLSPLDLKGDFSENIYGLKGEVIQLTGTFLARRINALPKEFDSVHESKELDEAFIGETSETFTLDIYDNVSITDVKLLMSLDHPITSGIHIELESPSGVVASIHDGDPSNVSLLNKQYDHIDLSVEPLEKFNGELSSGAWKLHIVNSTSSIAQLKQFELKFTGPEVYSLKGSLPLPLGANTTLRLSGCGISQTIQTNSEGDFEFTHLIPCDYQITISELGYVSNTTNYQLLAGAACADFVCNISDTSELTPELIVASDALLVTPSVAALPATITAMDLKHAEGTSRTFELYKKVATWWSIQEQQGERVLALSQSGSKEVPPGGNYIAYSESPENWQTQGVTLAANQANDPSNNNKAVQVTINDNTNAEILNSQTMGQGAIPVVQNGDKLTLSVFAQPDTLSQLLLQTHSDNGQLASVTLNIHDASIVENTESGLTSFVYATPLDNGWYRISATVELQSIQSNVYFKISAPQNSAGLMVNVFGPQAEWHQTANWLSEESVATTSIFAPLFESGYVPTQSNHETTLADFEFSGDPIQTITTDERKVSFATLGGEKDAIITSDAGLYQVRLNITGSEDEYPSNPISLYHRDASYAYFASAVFNAAAGSALTSQSRYMMDSATFDIDRFPFSESEITEESPGVTGTEDSDHFTAGMDEATQTNALCHKGVGESTDSKGEKCMDGQLHAPVGDAPHYRMFMSFGQPLVGGSVYGEMQIPVDDSTSEDSSSDEVKTKSVAIRMDTGIQTQSVGAQ